MGAQQLPPDMAACLAGLGLTPEDVTPRSEAERWVFEVLVIGAGAGWTQEQSEQVAQFTWPLVHYRIHGIPMGQQWDILGRLAARYARMYSTRQLADHLWAVMQAGPRSTVAGETARGPAAWPSTSRRG